MDHEKTLGLLLDLGTHMMGCGAETHRVEDSLYRLLAAYGFTQANVWVVPSNIQATAVDPEGRIHTQIRHVRSIEVDFDRLDSLNSVSRYCCEHTPDEREIKKRLSQALEVRRFRRRFRYPAAILAGVGFGVFFNCDAADALAAVPASLLIAAFGRSLSRRESNPLILNFVIAFVAELFIMLCVKLGLGHHTGHITVGVVMLLISALGTTNGVRDLVHLDTLSGVMNISASLTGALGIALGIALPILLLPSWSTADPIGINPNPIVTMIAATVGCVGFALFFNVIKPKHVLTCAIGAALTWGVYLGLNAAMGRVFLPTLIGAAVCAVYALAAARVNKAPATVFQTICIFPLIPGSALYYAAYGVVTGDAALTREMGFSLFAACFAIVLGFMAVEAVNRFIRKR
ncbi:MAG: threonine/serine exporter family protein [Clostridia bacterium]|nr:threonine/serine exporter family protein [Clostridia bacterium]MBQ4342162.1 threonine/serine exporter family protein [Clostridia bacterium]